MLQVAVKRDLACTTVVYLFDLLALKNTQHTSRVLQEVLQSSALVKIGYGMYEDLGALVARMGDCCATAHPQLDIMHAMVALAPAGIIPPRSLSDACDALLGQSLDKTQQCSAWGNRPLTDAQRQYAALDAYCLLMLYDKLLERAIQHDLSLPTHRLCWPEGPKPPQINKVMISPNITNTRFYKPWPEGDSPRFVCDDMLEGLARQLRLCGVDAASVYGVVGAGHQLPRHQVHRVLVDLAHLEQRVVLTKDKSFVRAGYIDCAWLVQGTHRHTQLEEVLHAFDIRVGMDDVMSRCSRCNGELLEEMFTRDTVPVQALGNVPPVGVGKSGIWVCGQCYNCYWQGMQYARARLHLKERFGKKAGGGDAVLQNV